MYGYQVPRLLSERKVLDSVGIVSLIFWCDFPLKAPQSERRRSVNSLLQSLSGKKLPQQWRSLTCALDETDGGELCQYPTKAVTYFSNPNRIIVHLI